MSIYSDNPQSILLNNRTRQPTLEQLTSQVNSLARILVSQSLQIAATTPVVGRVSNLQTRSLNSDFSISTTQDAIVIYTIQLTVSLSLTGTDTATVTLFVNNVATVAVQNLVTLVLGLLSLTQTQSSQEILIGYVPAGSTVNLTSSGTGTSTLIQSLEVLL